MNIENNLMILLELTLIGILALGMTLALTTMVIALGYSVANYMTSTEAPVKNGVKEEPEYYIAAPTTLGGWGRI